MINRSSFWGRLGARKLTKYQSAANVDFVTFLMQKSHEGLAHSNPLIRFTYIILVVYLALNDFELELRKFVNVTRVKSHIHQQ